MRRNIGFLILCTGVLVMLLCVTRTIVAVEAEKVTVVGTVSVTEDGDWNITSAKVTTKAGVVYHITLDVNGKALANKMEMEEVEVTGTVREKNETKWLTVISYKKVVVVEDNDD